MLTCDGIRRGVDTGPGDVLTWDGTRRCVDMGRDQAMC